MSPLDFRCPYPYIYTNVDANISVYMDVCSCTDTHKFINKLIHRCF